MSSDEEQLGCLPNRSRDASPPRPRLCPRVQSGGELGDAEGESAPSGGRRAPFQFLIKQIVVAGGVCPVTVAGDRAAAAGGDTREDWLRG